VNASQGRHQAWSPFCNDQAHHAMLSEAARQGMRVTEREGKACNNDRQKQMRKSENDWAPRTLSAHHLETLVPVCYPYSLPS
jgi:hypothetical protein